jgi:hypothetical protein
MERRSDETTKRRGWEATERRSDEKASRRDDEATRRQRDESKLMSFKEKQQIKKVNRYGQRAEKAAIR